MSYVRMGGWEGITLIIYFYVYGHFLCIYVYASCVQCLQRLAGDGISAVRIQAGAWNSTLVLWKSN